MQAQTNLYTDKYALMNLKTLQLLVTTVVLYNNI